MATGKKPNAAELLARCLENEDVEFIFGIPGEENIHFIDALSRSPIRFILVRHEQGAAFMADMYGRLTGRAGVCIATLGPGAINLLLGVADAHADSAPLQFRRRSGCPESTKNPIHVHGKGGSSPTIIPTRSARSASCATTMPISASTVPM